MLGLSHVLPIVCHLLGLRRPFSWAQFLFSKAYNGLSLALY